MVVAYATMQHIECQVDSHVDENPAFLLTVPLRIVLTIIAYHY